MFLDAHALTPVWLYWLDLSEEEWDEYTSRVSAGEVARDEFEHHGLKEIPLVVGGGADFRQIYDTICNETGACGMTADSAQGLWLWLGSNRAGIF
jgi:hypothetical protein